jgi:hypothetical protein
MRKGHAMNIGKLTSGRTMRVATVFTGVAAGAAAFTPFAPAAHASMIQKHFSCSRSPTWFRVYYVLDNGQHASDCYGFRGSTTSGTSPALGFCGGNNFGSFSATEEGTNKTQYGTFSDGTTIYWFTHAAKWNHASVDMSRITINAWGGGDTCPEPYA